jgi:membrane dipeptidase
MTDAEQLHRELMIVNGTDAAPTDDALVERMKQGGVTCNVVYGGTNLDDTADLYRFIGSHPKELVFATSVKQIREAKQQGKTAIVFNWQHSNSIGSDLELLATYHRLGIMICGLCYNVRNLTGDGCVERTACGLSLFGERVVKRINELRMVLDIGGHTSEATGRDALEVSKGPVICSHTNCRAITDNPRCMTDDFMRALAKRGGVIGITCYGFFVTKTNKSTIPLFLDHIDHAVKVAGADHVGIALDQIQYPPPPGNNEEENPDPYVTPPRAYPRNSYSYTEGLEDLAGTPKITAGLLQRGYAPGDIRKIMGENWLRVYEEVWGS